MKNLMLAVAVAVCGFTAVLEPALGQSPVFNYQGRLLENGQPANGVYDFTFALYDAGVGGAQVGVTFTNAAVGVTNGLFAVALDFGGNFPGADRWLEIGVRSGAGAFTVLGTRQKLTATPYAITAANLTGGLPAVQLSGVVPPAQTGSFTNHNDVIITALAPGHGIVYSGAVWTNSPLTLSGGGGGPTPSNNIPVSLTYAGTNVPVDASLGTHFRLVATNSFLLQNPTGASDAQRMIFEIIQDNTGGWTMALGGAFKLGADISMVNLTTNANRRDFVTCVSSGTNFYVVGFVKGY